jgi:hypothetical protein
MPYSPFLTRFKEASMELASQDAIAALLNADVKTPRPRAGRGCGELPVPARAAHRRRSCHCGRCPECVENARWQRIFEEKFADPTYYSRPISHFSSPLSSL